MMRAEELIATAGALLLDFDGPVTALMPPPENAQAAEWARMALAGEVSDEIATTTDHLAVLRFAAQHRSGRLLAVEQNCTEAEVACAQRSEPSPEIRRLMAEAARRDTPVAIVSNNSEAAVRAFLDRFEWARGIRVLACRTPANVHRMKPGPHFVEEAVRLLGVSPIECVLLGDSVTDMAAGQAAGVTVVGLAKTPARGEELKAAGAAALLERPHVQ